MLGAKVADMDTPTPVNHVFVDFENVHTVDTSLIGAKAVTLTLLMGAKQTKLDVDIVEQLLKHAASVQLIRLKSSGKNALDFALAYELGRAAATHPRDYFHIVSKDQGFKPLIEELRLKNIRVRLHADFSTLTFAADGALAKITSTDASAGAKLPPPLPLVPVILSDNAQRILENLRKGTARPRTKKTLVAHAVSLLGKKVVPLEAEKAVEELIKSGHVTLNDKGALTYHLD